MSEFLPKFLTKLSKYLSKFLTRRNKKNFMLLNISCCETKIGSIRKYECLPAILWLNEEVRKSPAILLAQ